MLHSFVRENIGPDCYMVFVVLVYSDLGGCMIYVVQEDSGLGGYMIDVVQEDSGLGCCMIYGYDC